MNLKKIQAMPFAPFCEESGVRWKATVKEPVVDGERLLVVDFLENTACNVYARNTPSFRIVCAKKCSRRFWIVSADLCGGMGMFLFLRGRRSCCNGF